jgi:phosphoenolpyruvate carboxykinase (ATP)
MFSHTKKDLTQSELVEETLKMNLGVLSHGGALVVKTGKFTGRSADDKYVVSCPYSEKHINWANKTGKLSREQALQARAEIFAAIENSPVSFSSTNQVGAHFKWRIKATLITQGPSHALFFNNMMREVEAGAFLEEWTVLHAPFYQLKNHSQYGVERSTAIILDFEKKEVLIAGTSYAGEVKKAMFSVLNTILPDHGVLPMHAGASISSNNQVSVFFGLSGTGKTTLSTDEGQSLIGDDEHGLSDDGIFNFEGGCYAKTAKLSQKDEPQIYKAATSWGTLLENVVLNSDRTPDFDDVTLTENGRASYPLTSIDGVHPNQMGPVAKNMFFLSADASGVLPPVASLNPEQAMEFFLCGYTSKLAGTELGIKEPKSAFSYCFGAPFMQRRPQEYAQLLASLMEKHKINVWLINTGWGKGGYGKTDRFPLKVTRQIIREIQKGKVSALEGIQDPIFRFIVPQNIEGVNPELLLVSKTDDEKALKLKSQFDQQLKTITA